MLGLPLSSRENRPLNVLCLGAHCDDIEIGCGATLLTLLAAQPGIRVHWTVFSSTPARKAEAMAGAEQFCAGAGSLDVDIHAFRDGYLPYEGSAVKDAFEETKRQFTPDVVFTHYRHDAHQDHRKVCELTWNTFRNHLILEYEIPKWDGDLGSPNTFVHIDPEIAEKKNRILADVYNSQNDKRWFTDDLFHSMLRLRGMESNSPTQLAEGFYTRKLALLTTT